MARQEFQKESMLNAIQQEHDTLKNCDLIVKNLIDNRNIPGDLSCAEGKEKRHFVNEQKVFCSSVWGLDPPSW